MALGLVGLNSRSRVTTAHDRPRIYVVDDDSAVRAAVSLLVSSCGWTPIPCANAEEFLDCYMPGACQCLILDIRMPGLSGVELQRELITRGDDLPVIVVTAHHDQPEADLARAQGALAVLSKPFDDGELVRCIHGAIVGI